MSRTQTHIQKGDSILKQKILIIGAGPAGLTAAYELMYDTAKKVIAAYTKEDEEEQQF